MIIAVFDVLLAVKLQFFTIIFAVLLQLKI